MLKRPQHGEGGDRNRQAGPLPTSGYPTTSSYSQPNALPSTSFVPPAYSFDSQPLAVSTRPAPVDFSRGLTQPPQRRLPTFSSAFAQSAPFVGGYRVPGQLPGMDEVLPTTYRDQPINRAQAIRFYRPDLQSKIDSERAKREAELEMAHFENSGLSSGAEVGMARNMFDPNLPGFSQGHGSALKQFAENLVTGESSGLGSAAAVGVGGPLFSQYLDMLPADPRYKLAAHTIAMLALAATGGMAQEQTERLAYGQDEFDRLTHQRQEFSERQPIGAMFLENAPFMSLSHPPNLATAQGRAGALTGFGFGVGNEFVNQVATGEYNPLRLGLSGGFGILGGGEPNEAGERVHSAVTHAADNYADYYHRINANSEPGGVIFGTGLGGAQNLLFSPKKRGPIKHTVDFTDLYHPQEDGPNAGYTSDGKRKIIMAYADRSLPQLYQGENGDFTVRVLSGVRAGLDDDLYGKVAFASSDPKTATKGANAGLNKSDLFALVLGTPETSYGNPYFSKIATLEQNGFLNNNPRMQDNAQQTLKDIIEVVRRKSMAKQQKQKTKSPNSPLHDPFNGEEKISFRNLYSTLKHADFPDRITFWEVYNDMARDPASGLIMPARYLDKFNDPKYKRTPDMSAVGFVRFDQTIPRPVLGMHADLPHNEAFPYWHLGLHVGDLPVPVPYNELFGRRIVGNPNSNSFVFDIDVGPKRLRDLVHVESPPEQLQDLVNRGR